MIQIRIANYDGSDPVILENAKSRSVFEAINSSDEGVSFEIAKNDPKAVNLNPDTTGYLKRWEAWDTVRNVRTNYGPITGITEQGPNWKVTGIGRSGLLGDFYKTKKTFYATIDSIVDDLRYENIAIEPRTSTLVPSTETSAEQTTVFGSVDIDEKYHGLSSNTKNNAIDDNVGTFKPGETEPTNIHQDVDMFWFWSGMSTNDAHIVDLGDDYGVNKITLNLPSWGGPQRLYNRSYDYSMAVAKEGTSSDTGLQGRRFKTFNAIFTSDVPNRELGGTTLYIGDNNGTLTVSENELSLPPYSMRYLRTKITDVHAWYGTNFDTQPSVDGWAYQCDPDYVTGSIPSISNPAVLDKEINTRSLEAANDCHASITEIGIYKEIIEKDTIKALALQRIDNNSFQIKYNHTASAGETKTTSNGFRKFEPGGFFRRVGITWSGANTAYNKFYDSDCTNCYPDGFNFGIMDQHNNLVFASDNSSGSGTRVFGAYTKHITMKGAANATVTSVDSWPSVTDALSWGGSYSYTETVGDTAVIHFKGQSFKWYATIPSNETGANVTVAIRSKSGTGSWSSYSNLSTFTLPSNISSEVVYEITYESGTLQSGVVYEIRITNNDGNYCSIDSIEGYWAGSMVEYNEDSARISIGRPERIKQIYDPRFSGGSMYKFTDSTYMGFLFTGDRIVITSAKGRNHGTARILITNRGNGGSIYDPGTSTHVFIPGGDPSDGSLSIDLDTGKRGNEITQYVLFDSDDYFTSGLPWDRYHVTIYLLESDIETYTSATADIEFDSFVPRCKDCTPSTGTTTTVNKPIYLDGIFAHEVVGLSVQFEQESHLDILKAVAEAIQAEWKVTEDGLRLEPRIGTDTNEYLREGENTLVDWQIVNDISQMATMLLSFGSDIDGLPLFAVTEDKATRARFGRTVMRQHDFRNISDYFQLVGLSRTELKRRRYPQKRITVTHVANNLDLDAGDSFLLWTKKMGTIRARIMRKAISESSSGRTFELECVTWPQIT